MGIATVRAEPEVVAPTRKATKRCCDARIVPGRSSSKPPAVATSMKQLDEYQQLIAERQRYALRRVHAKPKADGTMRYECPASAGRVACPLKQKSLTIASSKGVILPTNVPPAGAQGDICKQATITVDLNDPAALEPEMGYVGGLYQKHPFGSDAHYDSMKRRAYVEGAFGNIKNEAEQSLRRPSIRVMGHAKMSLVTVFVVAAANLRMGRNWLRRHHRHSGPSISPAMAAAVKAQNTALARRRRKAAEQIEVKAAGRPARLRPGGRRRDRPPRGGPPA